ncbi:MAG: glycoside hydrolase family 99-like domain-containing protein [Alphaproteobacteria bacterium]|nr:glycoside hydrolase family 99-like domain-containing protein [Alphaproteobacteria bacterium]
MDRVERMASKAVADSAEAVPSNVRLIAFYLPQFHPIPENDRWWGPGFTDWQNVARATPLFDGHYQPRLPGALGFYDLRLDEVRHKQVELARTHGVYGFCYYYYWFNGRRILERPLERYVADPAIDFPFCICWANENWSRRWDGGNREVLLVQEHDTASDMQFIRDVMPLLKDPRYIRVNGMPLLVLYRADLLKVPPATAAGWREECERAGLPGIHLCAAQTFEIRDPRPYGFDSACEFPPHRHALGHITNELAGLPSDFKGWVCDYELVARHSLTAPVPDYPLYRGIFPSWDNTARKRLQALIFHNASPARYEYWLRGLVEYTRQNLVGDQRIIFVNAWNEWAEGAHLEPDLKNGSSYLEATLRALAGRTDPAHLFGLLDEEIRQIGNPDLRERIAGYAREIDAQLRHLGRTVDYFTREREMVERLRQEREATAFHRQEIEAVFGPQPGTDIECWFERINGRPLTSHTALDVRTTVHIEGWMLSPGIVPDAETTARFVLLHNMEGGQTYVSHVYQYWTRQDVAAARHTLDSAYTMNCGFGSLFSVSNVPPGSYRLGCGMRNSNKSVCAWSDYRIQLLGGAAPQAEERPQARSREGGRKRRTTEPHDA